MAVQKLKTGSLALSEELLESYVSYFTDLGMDKKQLDNVTKNIIELLGGILKSADDMRKATDEIARLCDDKTELLQFISDNVDYIYNDYSRNISGVVQELIECSNNKKEAFKKLKSHPEWLRWGIR